MDVNDDFSNNSSPEESCTPEELKNVARNESLNLIPETFYVHLTLMLQTKSLHETAAQIFLVSVRSARQNLVLASLPRYTQDLVLSHTWSQLLLLHSVSWLLPIPSADYTDDVCHLLLACQDLRLDPVETNLLETLILCRHDPLSVSEPLRSQLVVQYERAQLALSHYASLSRYTVLLLMLPALQGVSAARLRSLLLDPIIGSVPIEHIIAII